LELFYPYTVKSRTFNNMSYVDFNGITMSVGRASYGGDSSDVSDNLTEDVVNIYSTVGAFAALKSDGSVVTWGGIEGVVSYNYWLTDGSFNLYYIREGENGNGESRVGINRNYPERSVDMSGTIRMGDQGTTDSIFLDFSGSDAFGRYTEISGNARDNIRKIVTSQYFTLILYQSGVVYLYTSRDRTNLGQIADIHGTTGVLDIATQEYDLAIEDQLVVAIMTDGSARAWTFAGPAVDTIIDELEGAPYKFRSISVGTVHTAYDETTKTCVAITYDDTYQSYGRIFPSGLYPSSIIGTNVQQVGTGENIVVYLRHDGRVVMNLVHSGLGMFDPDDIGYNSLQNIVQISVGKSHVVALDKHGVAYGWQGSSIPSSDTRVKGIGPLSMYPNIYSRAGVWMVSAGGAHTVLLLRENNTIVACGKTHSPDIDGVIPGDIYAGIVRVFAGSHTTFVQEFEPNNRIDGATQFRDRIIIGDSSGALSHGSEHTLTLYDTRNAGSAGSLYIGGLGDNTAYSRMILGDDISFNAPYASKWSFEHGRGGPIDENHMRVSYTSGNRRIQPVTMDTSGNVRIGYDQDASVYTHRLDVSGNVNMTGALTTGNTATIGNNLFVRNNALCVIGNQVGIGTGNPTPGTLLDVDGNARVDGNMTITGTTNLDTITLQNGYTIGSYFTVSSAGVGIGTTTLTETLTLSGNASVSDTIYGRRAIVGKVSTDSIHTGAQLDVSGHTVLSGKVGIGFGNAVPDSASMDVSGAMDVKGTTRIFGSTSIIRNQVSDTALDVSGMTIFRGGNVGIGKTNPTARLDVIGTASVVGNASVMGNLGIGKTNPSAALDVVGTSNLAGQTVIYGNVGIGKNPLASLDVAGSILASENIGIGKTNPSVAFDVVGSSAISGTSNLFGNVAIGKTTIGTVALDVSGQSYVSEKSSFGSIVSISGETFMTSNVGIGKTTTTTHLDVSGNAIVSNRMSVGKTTLPVLTATSLDVSGNTQVVGNVTISGDTIITSKMNVGKSTAPNSVFNVDVSGSIRSSALINADTLDISGNSVFRTTVGIGKTNPSFSLDISGNANVNGILQVNRPVTNWYNLYDVSNSSFVIYGNSGSDPISTESDNAATLNSTLSLVSTSSYSRNRGSSIAFCGRAYNYSGSFIHLPFARITGVQQVGRDDYGGDLVFEVNGSNKYSFHEVMRISSNKFVGIGKTNPSVPFDVSGNVAFDGNTFYVDAGNNRVGIGTLVPSALLDVNGNMNVVGNLSIQGSFTLPALSIPGSSTLIGNVGIGKSVTGNTLDVSGNGVFSSSMTIGSNLIVDTNTLVVDATNNRVGIGLTNPTKTLEVSGTSRISSTLDVSGATNITGNLGVKTNVFVVDTASDRVGIGLSTPSVTLEVSGNVIVDRDVFVLDGTTNRVGIGLSNPSVTLEVSGNITFDRNLFVVDATTNRVGIGLTTPTTTLDVSGSAIISGDITSPALTGQISYFASTTAPNGWLKCNGSTLTRTTYPGLFNFLVPKSSIVTFDVNADTINWNNHGLTTNEIVYFTTSGTLPTGLTSITTPYYVNSVTTNTFRVSSSPSGSAINIGGTPTGTHTAWNAPFGIGNGSTTFRIPDLRGLFIRSFHDGSSSYEPDTSRPLGSYQADEFRSHNHNHLYAYYAGNGLYHANDPNGVASGTDNRTSGNGAIQNRGGDETRPKNITLLACIKY
jgi:microcystin-dependent protein